MSTFKILNKVYNTNNICTINYEGEKLAQQRKLGMKTVVRTVTVDKFAAQVHGKAGNNNIDCILINGKPSKFLAKLLNEIYWKNASKKAYDDQLRKMVMNHGFNTTHKHIYYKENEQWYQFIPDAKDTAQDKRKDKQQNIRTALNEQTDSLYNGMRISDERKAKMKRYIRYYELEIPQTEPEWVETFHQLAYYIKNNIEYAFDENQYEICEECGDLVRRGTEHCCYCELPITLTKIDYLVNGGE